MFFVLSRAWDKEKIPSLLEKSEILLGVRGGEKKKLSAAGVKNRLVLQAIKQPVKFHEF